MSFHVAKVTQITFIGYRENHNSFLFSNDAITYLLMGGNNED